MLTTRASVAGRESTRPVRFLRTNERTSTSLSFRAFAKRRAHTCWDYTPQNALSRRRRPGCRCLLRHVDTERVPTPRWSTRARDAINLRHTALESRHNPSRGAFARAREGLRSPRENARLPWPSRAEGIFFFSKQAPHMCGLDHSRRDLCAEISVPQRSWNESRKTRDAIRFRHRLRRALASSARFQHPTSRALTTRRSLFPLLFCPRLVCAC